MARRIVLVLVAAAILAMMLVVAAAPAVVAQEKGKEKKAKEMPKTGGISPGNVALAGLGASALLVGGGLLVRRRTNRE